MKQKFLIFLALITLIIVLVGLNAASYVQKEKVPDNELFPNRSSYNAGATGTRAFYDLLNETGRKPSRWLESPKTLLSSKNAPNTFVIIGSLKREFTDPEAKDLLQWVSEGGNLVIIDRKPPADLIATTANWSISLTGEPEPGFFGVDPSDSKKMTEKVAAAKPVQPTVYTKNVNAAQPSIFASTVIFERFSGVEKQKKEIVGIEQENGIGSGTILPPTEISPSSIPGEEDFFKEEQLKAAPPLPEYKNPPTVFQENSNDDEIDSTASIIENAPDPEIAVPASSAPVVHLASREKNILVDAPFGSGRIVYLADPFIVSNGGINLVDNAQLGINIVASGDGTIAFDEYHQGYGTNNNRLFQYFAGTPVVAIFLQICLLAGLVFLSQSRRFARALPENEPNRLSKLEYVSAMAELQRRTKAFDLAIENIYTDFRRRAAKLVGADVYATSRIELAKLIAERGKSNESEIAELMRQCEDVMHGAPTGKKEVLRLAARLREIEEKLGLKRTRKRDVT